MGAFFWAVTPGNSSGRPGKAAREGERYQNYPTDRKWYLSTSSVGHWSRCPWVYLQLFWRVSAVWASAGFPHWGDGKAPGHKGASKGRGSQVTLTKAGCHGNSWSKGGPRGCLWAGTQGYLAFKKQTATMVGGSGKETGVGAGSSEQMWVSGAWSFLRGDENVLNLDCDIVVWPSEYTKNHWSVCVKFMVCELHLIQIFLKTLYVYSIFASLSIHLLLFQSLDHKHVFLSFNKCSLLLVSYHARH